MRVENPNKLIPVPDDVNTFLDLPEGWAYPKIGEILTVNYGKGLKESVRVPMDVAVYGSNGIVGQHHIALTKGPTIIIGRKGTVGAVHFSNDACWPIDTTYYIDEFNGLEPKYLLYSLRSLSLTELDTSTAIPGLNRNELYDQHLPLSPLPEQKRIVAKLERLLTRVNTTKERLAKVSMVLKRFRQAVLAAACSGHLTSDWREKNPDLERFSELLIRIRKGLKTKLLENATTVQTEKNEVPNSWNHVELGAALESLSNGIYKPESFYSTDGVICLRMYNIQNGKIIWRDLKRMLLTPEEIEKYSLKPGDMLVNRVNSRELVGKAAIIEEIEQPVVFESKNIRLRFIGKDTLPKFINFCFMTRMVRDVLEHSAKQTVGMATISQPQISRLILPIPPVEEQKEIVRRVEAMFKLADTIEKRVAAVSLRAEKLTQAILAKAFRGELVPTEAELARREGRSYESASELLDRIKSDREISKTSTSDRRRRVNKRLTQ